MVYRLRLDRTYLNPHINHALEALPACASVSPFACNIVLHISTGRASAPVVCSVATNITDGVAGIAAAMQPAVYVVITTSAIAPVCAPATWCDWALRKRPNASPFCSTRAMPVEIFGIVKGRGWNASAS